LPERAGAAARGNKARLRARMGNSGFRAPAKMCSSDRMNFESLAKPAVLTQPVYEPGKPIEYVARELGLDPDTIIKLASNENPFGPSPRAVAAAKRALEHGELYPDGGCFELRQKLAAKFGLAAEQFVVGNGSNEIIELLGHAFVGPGDEVVMAAPAFVVYKLVTLLFGAKAVEVPLRDWRHDLEKIAAAITPRTKLVFVCSPNNPTGTANTEAELTAFARALPDHVVGVFDEAYAEFLERAPDLRPLIAEGRKIVCLRTFSKIYGLASLRVGYGYASAELCALLNRVRQPFNVNAIAQAAAVAALDDREFAEKAARENRAGIAQLERGCRELGLEIVPSVANFMLMRVGDGTRVFDALQLRGVIVRPVKSYGLPEWIRVTVGTREQNERLLAELRAINRQV
jgi:histidinol-phosphate aminotransferase